MIDVFQAKQLLGEQFVNANEKTVQEIIRLAYIVARIAVENYIVEVNAINLNHKTDSKI